MQRYPLYRLEGGQIVVQEKEGARWASLDSAMANAMLAVFNGMTLEALRNTVITDSIGAPVLRHVA